MCICAIIMYIYKMKEVIMNITIGILFKKLIKKWLVIVASIILFASIGLFYAQVCVPKVYEASAIGTVNYKSVSGAISDNDFENMIVLSKDADFIDYAFAMFTEAGVSGVEKADIKSSIVISRYMVGEEPSHNLIKIVSSFDDPNIGHSMLENYTIALENYLKLKPIVGSVKVELSNVSVAEVSNVNIADKTTQMIVIGGLFGGVFSVIGLIIWSITSRKLKNIYSFNDEFDMQVLGFMTYPNEKENINANVVVNDSNTKSVNADKGDIANV